MEETAAEARPQRQRLRIVSWNINGLKRISLIKPLAQWLQELQADILCVQETKTTREMLDSSVAAVEGYHMFFSFCRAQKGYSGVCTFVRKGIPVLAAQDGLTGTMQDCGDSIVVNPLTGEHAEFADLDREGRAMITDHGSFLLLNIYAPCGSDDSRYEFKLKYHNLIESTCFLLQATHNKPIIVVGDLNVAHRLIDHCDPPEEFEEYEHRKWINRMLHEDLGGLVDTFRAFHPTRPKAYTCWNTKTSARQVRCRAYGLSSWRCCTV
jgi:AP endonuclease-2